MSRYGAGQSDCAELSKDALNVEASLRWAGGDEKGKKKQGKNTAVGNLRLANAVARASVTLGEWTSGYAE